MSDSILRVTRFTVLAKGASICSDGAISVEICDDGAGEYLALETPDGDARMNFDEWQHICKAADVLMLNSWAAEEGTGGRES